jgi:hypothetical protein
LKKSYVWQQGGYSGWPGDEMTCCGNKKARNAGKTTTEENYENTTTELGGDNGVTKI